MRKPSRAYTDQLNLLNSGRHAKIIYIFAIILISSFQEVKCLRIGDRSSQSPSPAQVVSDIGGVRNNKNVTTTEEDVAVWGGVHEQNNFSSSSNSSSRNSRQLWSVLENVVNKYKQPESNSQQKLGTLGTLASSFIGNLIVNGIKTNLGSSVSPSPSTSVATNHYFQQDQPYHHDPYQQHHPLPPTNPNDYMHYLLLNSQQNQHSSLSHYQSQQQQKFESTLDLIKKYKDQMTSSPSSSHLPGSSVNGGGGDSIAEGSSIVSTGNQILNKLALGTILDDFDLENVSNFLSFGSFERMVEKVNKFDKLKCIPRLLCQMVAKRQEDEKAAASKTTEEEKGDNNKRRKSDIEDETSGENQKEGNGKEEKEKTFNKEESQIKPASKSQNDDEKKPEQINDNKEEDEKESKEEDHQSKEEDQDNDEDDEDADDDDDEDDDNDEDSEEKEKKEYIVIKGSQREIPDKTSRRWEEGGRRGQPSKREGRIFKINGADLALEQFVKFLELMQLKDWSLYPYVNGAYQGHQVTRSEDCGYKFPSCPFSDEQLVYYFNNYNGGFFQSI